jgi:hypothetical protein
MAASEGVSRKAGRKNRETRMAKELWWGQGVSRAFVCATKPAKKQEAI